MDLKRAVGSLDLFNIPDFIKIGLMSILFMMLVYIVMEGTKNFFGSRGVNSSDNSTNSNIITVTE